MQKIARKEPTHVTFTSLWGHFRVTLESTHVTHTSLLKTELKMSLEKYKEALRKLSEEGPWRSETAHLKHLLEEVEAALAVGVKRELVLEVLHKQGFKFSMRGFETALYRLRKRKKAAASPKAKALEQLQEAASKTVTSAAPKAGTKPTQPAAQLQQEPLTEQEERELREYKEFEKTVLHLPVVQRAKKLADFLEKQSENKMSPTTRRMLERDEKKKQG